MTLRDIGFSRELKAAVFKSIQRPEQRYGLTDLRHRDSHKSNSNYEKRNPYSINERSNN